MKKNSNLIYWIVAGVLVIIAIYSGVHMHQLESKNAVVVSKKMSMSSSISTKQKKIKKQQTLGMAKKVEWNKPSMTIPYPDMDAYKNVKKKDKVRLVVSTKKQRVYVMSGPYILYTMYASVGKNYEKHLPIQHVTPVGKYKLNQARGQEFYDESRKIGGKYWTSYKGPYHFQSVPMDKNGKVDQKLAERLGKTNITRKHNVRAYGSILLTEPDAKWIYENLPAGTKVTIKGKDVIPDNFKDKKEKADKD